MGGCLLLILACSFFTEIEAKSIPNNSSNNLMVQSDDYAYHCYDIEIDDNIPVGSKLS